MKNVYLDYCASTPIDEEVLQYYNYIMKKYIANPNSIHMLGTFASSYYKQCVKKISDILNCSNKELIFTGSACESNSMVFRGIENLYENKNHIITSKLEHKSILDEAKRLQKKGFRISYVKINKNGLIDLDDLKKLLNDKTVLVSICGVNSETGYTQDIKSINKIIKTYNSDILFHSDLTQALGKIKIDLSNVDLASFSAHKIYAPNGLGVLYKKDNVKIENLIGGATLLSPYRGGTPSIHLIGAFSYALEKINNNLDKNYKYVEMLNKKLCDELSKYNIKINSNENSIPHIINISLLNMDSLSFIKKMNIYGISVSSRSACSSLNESTLLNELNNNNKSISKTSIRISLSHLTTMDEINYFIEKFDNIIK